MHHGGFHFPHGRGLVLVREQTLKQRVIRVLLQLTRIVIRRDTDVTHLVALTRSSGSRQSRVPLVHAVKRAAIVEVIVIMIVEVIVKLAQVVPSPFKPVATPNEDASRPAILYKLVLGDW